MGFDVLVTVDPDHPLVDPRHHLRLCSEDNPMSGQAEYMRGYRKTESGRAALDRQKKRETARKRALTRLAVAHEAEFRRLLTEEMMRIGL